MPPAHVKYMMASARLRQAVISSVSLKPMNWLSMEPYMGAMRNPVPKNDWKMPEDMLFTSRSCPGYLTEALSTISGNAGIYWPPKVTPMRTYPRHMSTMESGKLRSREGPTSAKAMKFIIEATSMMTLLSIFGEMNWLRTPQYSM